MGKLKFVFILFCSANSKNALTKDLIEGLEKDLEKLKRFEENIKVRKTLSMKGG